MPSAQLKTKSATSRGAHNGRGASVGAYRSEQAAVAYGPWHSHGVQGLILLRRSGIPKWPPSVSPQPRALRWHIPMHHLHAVSGFVQALAYLLGDHYRTVLAASAAKANG